MLRPRLLLAAFGASSAALFAQTPADLPPPAQVIALYDGPATGSENWDWTEYSYVTPYGNTVTRNVTQPTLQYYPADPAKANEVAVIIAPGGGFTDLMIKYEGVRTALALNALGIDAYILKYRLIYTDPAAPLPQPGEPPPPRIQKRSPTGEIIWGPQIGQNIHDFAHEDAKRAITWLRDHTAAATGEPASKIGVIGFSAGAFISVLLALDEPPFQPDFAASIYGPDTLDRPVTANTPPMFIAVASDDAWSEPLSLKLYQAWREAERPAELHIFQTGGHGFLKNGGGSDFYIDRFAEWMRANGWLPPGPEGTGKLFR